MSIIDIVLLIPLAYGLIRGLFRGFFKEIASVAGVVLGIWAARAFAPAMAERLATVCDYTQTILVPVTCFVIFLLIAIGLHIAAFFLEKLFGFVSLGWLNRLFGALSGVLKVWLILCVCVLCFDAVNTHVRMIEQQTIEGSALYKATQVFGDKCLPFLASEVLAQ